MKTSELIGPALNWVVAKCEGYTDLRRNPHRFANDMLVMTAPRAEWGVEYLVDLDYSTDWSQGGPIIERERITIDPFDDFPNWCATIPGHQYRVYGPTLLIAAMRCYVASKLGDEVDIPEELK